SARDQRQRVGLGADTSPGADRIEVLHQYGGFDAAQVEALAARQHGHRNLADLGGGEHELDVRRRLLERLEQGVERLRRQHVHFVEDVDLVAGGHRRIAHRVVDLADVVDAVVRRRIHLDDVRVPAFHDGLAVHAELRQVRGRAGDRAVGELVVERAGENARRRGLADAAYAGEDPGLGNAARGERIGDRAHHGVLADQVGEGLRPVFAREHAVGADRRLVEAGPLAAVGRRGVVHEASGPPRTRPAYRRFPAWAWEADERPEPDLVRAASFRT